MPEYDFYAQDTWKILPNVVLDLGLRWEIKLSPRTNSNFLLRPNEGFSVGSATSETIAWFQKPLSPGS
jgi:outer membrane receptor protein involved in Fe transport